MKKKIGLLVIGWCLLCLGAWISASYQQIFTDDFSRPDGEVGNGWKETNSPWVLSGGKVLSTQNTINNTPLIRPETFRNGKIEFVRSVMTPYYAPFVIARYTKTTDGENYYVGRILNNSEITITKTLGGILYNDNTAGTKIAIKSTPLLGGPLRGEFIVNSLSEDTTYLEFNVYDMTGNTLATITGTDSTPVLQTSGNWGISAYDRSSFDDFSLYSGNEDTLVVPPLAADFVFSGHKKTIKIGDSVRFTITGTGGMTIILSDDKKGTFLPNGILGGGNVLSLNASNSYTATINYTPTQAGLVTLTILGIGREKITKTSQIFVSPYATTIGYIGDSITYGVGGFPNAVQIATTLLGTEFIAINRGVSGSTTKSRIHSLLTDAISVFQSAGVEIVSIMLGTNDSKVAENISIDDYTTNLETIINQLKLAGIKKIILNEPPYIISKENGGNSQWDNTSITKMTGYIAAIDPLVDGEQVLRGDTQAYAYFEANQTELPDKIHPNTLGHQHLGEFRASAISGVLHYQINPDHHFTGGSNHTLGTSGSLTFRVDKYLGEFADVVRVDSVQLTSSNYKVTSGNTNISLNADYLNTLSTGSHTLSVGFEGGVWIEEDFTISPAATVPPSSSPNVGGGGGGWGSTVNRDYCPNGDNSPSYYDGICDE